MEFTYKPRGVCSQSIRLVLDGETIASVKVTGGCSGNLQGVCRLVEGMNAREAIGKLKGIRCGFKATSCPDQLSLALERALAQGGQL